MNNEVEVDATDEVVDESQDSLLKKTATQELVALLETGKSLRVDMEAAKTRTKKLYIRKKLDKINTQATQMLVAIDQLDKIAARREESDVDVNEEELQKSLNKLTNISEDGEVNEYR